MMTLRCALMTTVLLSLAAPCAGERPNVLLFVCSNLNTWINPYSDTGARTPAMARLAANGVTFHHAYSNSAQDGPARAILLSGRHAETTGVLRVDDFLYDQQPLLRPLPQRLKEAGYWTASAGRVFKNQTRDYDRLAWHKVVHHASDQLPMVVAGHKEFVKEYGSVDEAVEEWRHFVARLGTQTRGEQVPGYGPSGLEDAAHADAKNVRDVARWLRTKPYGDQPFFIAIGSTKPHLPFVVPQKYFELYADQGFAPALIRPGEWNNRPGDAINRRFRWFGFELDTPDESLRGTYIQAYFACVSFVDAQLGRVLDALEETGQAKNTVVLFMSDVGYQLGDHSLWGKDTLTEHCLRVPLIVAAPSGLRGKDCHSVVSLIDLYPTILDLCGAPADGQAQGTSLRRLIEGGPVPDGLAAYSVATRRERLGRSLRTSRWRYNEWEKGGVELYDHQEDPHEFENLAGDPAYSEQQKQLKNALAAARANVAGDRP